ncbi:MAG: hypothetical protein ACRDRX_26545 [Pseudonocardiaceae bacterium]
MNGSAVVAGWVTRREQLVNLPIAVDAFGGRALEAAAREVAQAILALMCTTSNAHCRHASGLTAAESAP